MNVLIGINNAHLNFVPNAGSSIMCSFIAIMLYAILFVISAGVYCREKINPENEYMLSKVKDRILIN